MSYRVKASHVDGVPDPGRAPEPRQIPLIAQAADIMTSTSTHAAIGAPADRV